MGRATGFPLNPAWVAATLRQNLNRSVPESLDSVSGDQSTRKFNRE